MMERQIRLMKNKVNYSLGEYNKSDLKEQWIRLTEGCPNNCPYCYEPTKIKIFKFPKIERNIVKIMDMNLIAKKEAISIIKKLGSLKVNNKVINYELICGVDFRFMTSEIANELKKARFRNIRFAWDWGFKDQIKIVDTIKMFINAGYNQNKLMAFMICNWKIPFQENLRKLDLLKVWNVKVADCYFDNQTFPDVIPIHWTDNENKKFRKLCRKHNQLVSFKIDPEVKYSTKTQRGKTNDNKQK
jgi:hypothetical protein